MDLDRSLAIFAALCETGHLLAIITDKISKVHDNRAKARCMKLKNEAELIETLLNSRQQAIDSNAVAFEAHSCVLEINDYVTRMIDATLLSDAVEVWWNRRYINILDKAARVKERFTIELLSRTEFHPLTPHELGVRPRATFQVANISSITFDDASHSTGRGIVNPHGNVVYHKLKDSKLSTESLEIYPRLQERAYVQQLKGLAEIDGHLYVFMQDCSSYPTLNKLCADRKLPSDLASRVEIALKIAQTVAWYHRSDVILKAIYDTSIAMEQSGDEKWTPILTGLEHMRHLHERTTGLRFDCRYEAPEYHMMKHHTFHTDVWSLGIVAWQIICTGVPYNISNFVDSDERDPNHLNSGRTSRSTRENIRACLESNTDPGEFPDDVPGYLANGLKKCWDRDALSRPKAMTVAKLLQEAWLRLLRDQSNLETQILQGESYTLTESTRMPISDLAALKKAKDDTQSLVNECRDRFINKEKDKLPQEKIPFDHVKTLAEAAEASDPECALLLGASVWWELLDGESLQLIENNRTPEFTLPIPSVLRAQLTLKFLQQAMQSGYEDGFLEMHRAYLRLSKFCKIRYDNAHDQVLTRRQASGF